MTQYYRSMAVARHGMCELTHGMTEGRDGNGMGAAWERHAICESILSQRHALTLAPRPVGPLRGRHYRHNHVRQTDTSRQLPGVISQRPSTVVERTENRH